MMCTGAVVGCWSHVSLYYIPFSDAVLAYKWHRVCVYKAIWCHLASTGALCEPTGINCGADQTTPLYVEIVLDLQPKANQVR